MFLVFSSNFSLEVKQKYFFTFFSSSSSGIFGENFPPLFFSSFVAFSGVHNFSFFNFVVDVVEMETGNRYQ